MPIEAYGHVHYGTKYPTRKNRRRVSELDRKNKKKSRYQERYGL